MKTFYVKELSKLTKVSIRTLHYYDKISLLKPSERLSNGYRVYSSEDLQKLEKIIALKFLGFTLSRIQQFITDEQKALELLESRLKLLQSEVSFLQEAQRPLLLELIQEYRKKKVVNWHDIASFIVAHTKTGTDFPNGSFSDKRHLESGQSEKGQKLIANVPSFTETEQS